MKIIGRQCFMAMLLLLPRLVGAQCTSATQQVTFDTVVTGSGNGFYTFSVPPFDASRGTLLSVEVRSVVTLRYTFDLENKENTNISYRVRVSREDEIFGDEIANPVFNAHQTTYGPYLLTAFDNVPGSGTDYHREGPMYVLDKYEITRTLSNTADFMGTADIQMDYSATTYSVVFGSVNYNFNGNAQDTMEFSVTYQYCPALMLAADLSEFKAVKRDNNVDLNWRSLNETANRKYTLQKSTDARNYSNLQTVPARHQPGRPSEYIYTYKAGEDEKGKIFFRLKQIDADGTIKYSAVRSVKFESATDDQLSIYPNPSKGQAQLVFHRTRRADWKVEVVNMSGQVILSRLYRNALQSRLDLEGRVAPGIYLIRATEQTSGNKLMQRMIIQ